jgi:hypothetical protein
MLKQCRALNNQGFRCKRRDTLEVHYYGDDIIYDEQPGARWVIVPLCSIHRTYWDKPHIERSKR